MIHLGKILACLACVLACGIDVSSAADGFIDCVRVELADERVICADVKLIQEDARMVTLYKTAVGLVGMGVRGDLQDSQVAWLDARHACKADAACIRSAYVSRVDRLQKVIDGVAARGPF